MSWCVPGELWVEAEQFFDGIVGFLAGNGLGASDAYKQPNEAEFNSLERVRNNVSKTVANMASLS